MKCYSIRLLYLWLIVCSALVAVSQERSGEMPRVIRYSGTLKNVDGTPRSGTLGIAFSIYADNNTTTAPLWQEIQNVSVDQQGNYTVLLGAARSEGLPAELFANNDARWLGIRVENEQEQPRVLLAAVPYALKAADAETLGGKPLSAFVLNETTTSGGKTSTSAQTGTGSSSPALQPMSINTTGSTGTQNYIAKWVDSAGTLGNSTITENNGNVGLSSPDARARLDLGTSTAPWAFLMSPSATALRYDSPFGMSHNDFLLGGYVDASSYPHHAISFGHRGDAKRFFEIGSASDANFNSATTFVPAIKISSGGGVDIVGKLGFGGAEPHARLDLGVSSEPWSLRVTPGATALGYDATQVAHNDLLLGGYVDSSGYPHHAMSFGHRLDPNRFFEIGSASDGNFNSSTTFVSALRISSGGNVGIGKTPTTALDVAGNINASGNVGATGTISGSNLSATGAVTFTGTPSGTAVSQGALYVNPASASAGQTLLGVAVGGVQKMLLDSAGNLSTAGNLNVSGNVAATGTFSGNGSNLVSVPAASVGTVPAATANLRQITYLGGCDSCAVLTTSDNQNLIYQNLLGAPLSFLSITCYSDAGTPSINIQRDNGTTANVTSSAIGCSTSGNTVSSFSIASLAANEKLNFLMTSPDGTAHRVTVMIKTTL